MWTSDLSACAHSTRAAGDAIVKSIVSTDPDNHPDGPGAGAGHRDAEVSLVRRTRSSRADPPRKRDDVLDNLLQRPDVRRAVAERDIAALYRHAQDAGVTQRRIAQLTGQSQSEISEILAGRSVTSYPVLVRIAAGFGIPRGYMGLAYTGTPVAWHRPPAAPCQPARLESHRRAPQPPRQWGPAEIRALREAMRLSVRQFADHLGVSDRMVSKWEAGAIPRPINQAGLDTALARASHDVQARFAGWPVAPTATGAGMLNGSYWLIQMPLHAPNLAAALSLAEAAATGAAHLPQVATHEATVAPRDRQFQPFPIFCDRVLPDGQPCRGRHGHQAPCTATDSNQLHDSV
jgi:transcriptional regulator with XRE-family HTH domain